MLRKPVLCSVVLSAVFGLCGCEYLRQHTVQDVFTGDILPSRSPKAAVLNSVDVNVPLQKKPTSVVVCRSQQCAPAKLSMSREYIYNSLLQLFENNNYQKILVCEADAPTRTCIENYITLPTKVGIVPTNAYIDYAKIADVVVGKKSESVNVILNYNLTYGGQTAECTPSQSLLFARSVDHVVLEDVGYNCKMTTVGTTNVKTTLAIDYIDLDYGYIGGYYSIGMSGPAYGGGNGYLMLRLPKNAYPLTPALTKPKQPAPQRGAEAKSISGFGAPQQQKGATDVGAVQVFPIEKKAE